MGLLVDGVWQEEAARRMRTEAGRFVRPATRFRNWVTEDGSPGPSGEGGFPAARVALSSLRLAGLPVGASHLDLPRAEGTGGRRSRCRWSSRSPDRAAGDSAAHPVRRRIRVNGKSELADIYLLADPRYSGRVSVPVLWDKERRTIVNNESAEIIRMFNGAFGRFTNVRTDYCPAPLRDEIDRINDLVYGNINNGVYRAGFAVTQDAYEEAFRGLFAALDELEAAPRAAALSCRHRDHRSRLAAVLHAHPLRCRLLRPLQVQPAADRRLSQSVELSARSLSTAWRRRDREHGPHQAALLRQPAAGEPDRHRAARPGTRFPCSARPRQVRDPVVNASTASNSCAQLAKRRAPHRSATYIGISSHR